MQVQGPEFNSPALRKRHWAWWAHTCNLRVWGTDAGGFQDSLASQHSQLNEFQTNERPDWKPVRPVRWLSRLEFANSSTRLHTWRSYNLPSQHHWLGNQVFQCIQTTAGSHYIARAVLDQVVLLPRPPKYLVTHFDYRNTIIPYKWPVFQSGIRRVQTPIT